MYFIRIKVKTRPVPSSAPGLQQVECVLSTVFDVTPRNSPFNVLWKLVTVFHLAHQFCESFQLFFVETGGMCERGIQYFIARTDGIAHRSMLLVADDRVDDRAGFADAELVDFAIAADDGLSESACWR